MDHAWLVWEHTVGMFVTASIHHVEFLRADTGKLKPHVRRYKITLDEAKLSVDELANRYPVNE